MKFSSISIAQAIQNQSRQQFSYYYIDDIQVEGNAAEPTLKINGYHKLTHAPFNLTLVAEQQANNPHNVHLTLTNQQAALAEWYLHHRSEYVNANHQTAEQLRDKQLVPENLYLIQDAAGHPGIDFLKLADFTNALNTLMAVSTIFITNCKTQLHLK